KFLAPAQNFVFAAKDGTIAYKANGNIPIYDSSEDALLPLPGWEKEEEWKGFIPFDELPKIVNPEKGFIATANNKIVGEDYPYHISNVWAQTYRYERIAEVLEVSDELTVEDMKALQMDITNLQAREFVPMFSGVLSNADLNENEQEALQLLENWDFSDDKDRPQPLIFHHWMDEIESISYRIYIPAKMMYLFTARGQTTDQLLRKAYNGEGSIWIEDAGGLEDVLHQSLKNTLTRLEKDYGDNIDDWKWGDYHKVQFYHPLSSVHPVLAYFFNNEDPIPV